MTNGMNRERLIERLRNNADEAERWMQTFDERSEECRRLFEFEMAMRDAAEELGRIYD